MKKLGGIYPALITPYTSDGAINHEALREIVEWNIEKGVDGFYVNGSTGECHLLSLDERKAVLETVVNQVRGRANIIAHIGCISTDQVIELGKHAKEIGVDAISAIPPFYYKYSADEIVVHYNTIVDAVQMPMIVYNMPAMTGVELTPALLERLTVNRWIIGVKHTSMNLFQLERMKKVRDDLVIFNGHDEVCLAGLVMGADGAIGTTYNFMAEKFLKIAVYIQENHLEEARREQESANTIIEALIQTGVFIGTKYLIHKMKGIDCGGCRKPFAALSKENKYLLDQVAEQEL
ncbi:MAG: N-acetylneuraminate lyase [Candidatus Merdivicinus sp.]|jgi:N-acetylneuraminate lyase